MTDEPTTEPIAPDEEALRLARARVPAGVVLDVKLPDLDGRAVREQLLRHAETADVPVHFISGMDAPGGALGPGVVGYLTKPATRDALVDAISALSRPNRASDMRVLIVEDDPEQSHSLVELLGESQLETDRRLARRRITVLRERLRKLSRQRDVRRVFGFRLRADLLLTHRHAGSLADRQPGYRAK